MARATVDVSLRADIKQLIDGLAQVEGVTKKEARAMVREMRKGYNAQVKAAQLAAKAQEKAVRGVGKTTEKVTEDTLDVVQKFSTEISSALGVGFLGDLEGFFDAARTGSERFGMGAAAAFAGVAGAAAVSIVALQQYTEAQRTLNREIAASAESLEGFVSPEMLQALQAFATEIELVDATMGRLAAESLLKSKERAIDFERAIVAVTSVGLPQWLGGAVSALDDFANAQTLANLPMFALGKALGVISDSVIDYGESLIEETRATTQNTEAAEEATEAATKQAKATQRLRKITIDLSDVEAEAARERKVQIEEGQTMAADITRLRKLEADALRDVTDADTLQILKLAERNDEIARLAMQYPGVIDSTAALANGQKALDDAIGAANEKAQAATFAKMAEDLNLAASATAHVTEAMATFAGLALDRFTELAEARRLREEERIDREAERHRQEVANLLESGRITQAQADGRIKTIDREAAASKRAINTLSQSEQKAAKRAFAVQQAGAASAVIMSGAEAYIAMLAALAPILTFGAPLAAAAIVGPAVAAQLAAIAAEKPPQFPTGGMVSPDHVVVGVQPDEGIISRRGVAALGGPQAVEQINQGIAPGATLTANIVLDQRVIGRAVAAMMPSTNTARAVGQVPIYGVG
tara:strand:+ start:2910 stop:4844 length:1935 start_codon:yes stop_codon:yes gene_type:complete